MQSLEEKPVSVGPWGGSGGYSWDDGVYSTIRQLVIVHGEGIDSIQIEYDKEGDSVWSLKHGGSGGHKIDKVNFLCIWFILWTRYISYSMNLRK
jgi:hypothetical protein